MAAHQFYPIKEITQFKRFAAVTFIQLKLYNVASVLFPYISTVFGLQTIMIASDMLIGFNNHK